MERKHSIWLICLLLLMVPLAAQEKVIFDMSLTDNGAVEKLVFQSRPGFEEVPDYYQNPQVPGEIVLQFPGFSFSEALKEMKLSRKAVAQVRVENAQGSALARVTLSRKTPFRLYTEKGKTVMEVSGVALASTTPAVTAKGGESSLSSMKVDKGADGALAVLFDFSKLPTYNAFYLDNPHRLVIDFYNTRNSLRGGDQEVNQNLLSRIRVNQNRMAPDRLTRVVFDIEKESVNYRVDEKGNRLVVNFPSATPVVASAQPVAEKAEGKPLAVEHRVAAQVPQNISHEGKTVHSEESTYSGEPMTLRLKDADLRDVLREIAIKAGLNLLIDPGITGKVTCEMVAVPWDQALDIFLKSNGLGKVMEGNVLRVGNAQKLASETDAERKLAEAKMTAGPTKVLTKTLSYAKAKDVSALLAKQLSARGDIILDERTNTLILSDSVEKVQLLEKMVDTLDTPNLQVNIKARVVETTSNYARNLGIQWGFSGVSNSYYGNQTSLQFPNNIAVSGNKIASEQGIYGPLKGYAVNLPAPAYTSGIGVSMGNVLDTFRLDMALTALENKGKAKILSMPEVTTQDNMKANVIQGKMIPVQTVQYNTVTTRYVNAALELHVTPHITAEGTVLMNLEIKNDNADFSNLVNGIPPIITQSANTSVMVKDGGTTVIGGIYRVEDSVTNNGVPGFSKIPILGALFKGSQRVGNNRELLIFITPRIMK